jgi:leucine dehydrogenase
VAGAANNQLAYAGAADLLDSRGILYAPDYVINAGGLLYVALTHQGVGRGIIAGRVEDIGSRLQSIFHQSEAEARSPATIADLQAQAILFS